MSTISRRDLIKSGVLGAVSLSVGATVQSCQSSTQFRKKNERKFTLGLASYTSRKFNLEQTLAMTRLVDLTAIALKSFHLPLDATVNEIKAVAAKTKSAELDLYGGGVIYMNDEHQVNQAFEYAKTAGMRVIIGVPNHELLGLVNQKVKEYDICVAIHNHGPGEKMYPSPESIYEKIKLSDKRVCLCLDIGHCQRLGLNPAAQAEQFADRLLDVHIKDVTESTENGKSIEIGRGVIIIPSFLTALLKINYSGVVAFEYEKDEDDPLPGLAESVGYVRGVLDVI
ncbi:sugar phosphate isomerase/epimerase [candidate division KSB1 bacterium]|nr:sugar phosphate isomerase/epimerase [candidate division KSB1 bacterium]